MGEVSSLWYWLAFLLYICFLLYIGITSYRKQKGLDDSEAEGNDYWISGRSQPGYMVGISMTSGWMLIGMMTWLIWAVYDCGLSGIWLVAVPWALSGIVFLVLGLIRKIRRIFAISQCQMLQNRFGMPARIFSAGINLFSFTIWSAAELFAASLIMAPALGISLELMIVIYAIPIAIYMYMGGFRSVLNANIIQFAMGTIILVTVVVSMGFAASKIASVNGTSILTMLQSIPLVNSYAYNLSSSTVNASNLMAFENISLPLIILIGLLPGWFTAEDFWLKTQAAKSTKEAYKGWGMMFGSLLAIVIIPCVLIGLFGLIIFEPEMVNGVVNAHASLGIEGGYAVLSAYINQMHPVLKAVMIFMLAAHTMSTVANYTNVSAMNLSYDILQPTVYRKLKWSDEKIVNWSRGIMAVMIVVNVCVAELMTAPSLDNILNLAYQLSSGLLSSAIAIMMLSLWWKRANLEGVLTGGICGAIGTFSFFIFEYVIAQHSYTMPVWDWIFGQGAMANSYYGYCVIGVFCGVLGLLIGTYLNPPPTSKQLAAIADEPIDDNEVFFEGLKASS